MVKQKNSIPIAPSLAQYPNPKEKRRRYIVDKRVFYLAVQAVLNAVVIGIVARGLVYLIDLITNLVFYGKFSFASASPAGHHLGLWVILIPVAGGLLVGLMARYGSKAIRGHGIPEAMEKIILEESRIPPVITFLKPLSAAISIGTGGPFGAEGPIIATGGAFGSLTGQWMHISPAERKIILSAGACAGMSAIFGTPLAGVLLAIELLLFEFSPRSIIPVALACVTGAAMHFWLFGNKPVFEMPLMTAPSDKAIVIYIVLGAVIGVIASLVSKSVYLVEDLFEKIPVHWMWWPAIGAIAVGITGYIAPYTLGVGYSNIEHLLSGTLPLSLLFGLCFLKYISWVISLGSGTSGGTLAPLLTIGGAVGALLGVITLRLFPSAEINLPTAALIGMAAMFAGASRALLTSIVFALETTGNSNGLIPLLGACVMAYAVSFVFMKGGSIMTEKIQRRGVKTPDSYTPDLLRTATVQQLMVPATESREDLPKVLTTDDLGLAAELMGRYGKTALWVVNNTGDQKVTGMITSAAILKYYSSRQQKEQHYQSPRKTKELLVKGRKMLKRQGEKQPG